MDRKLIVTIIVVLVILVGVVVFFLSRTTETGNTREQENIIMENESIDESQSNINNTVDSTENDENIANSNQENSQNTERNEDMKLYIKVNNRTLTATLSDNSSVDALVEKLQNGPLTINMSDYANMEKVGSLGFSLPRNDEQISTGAGDLILYQGNSFVIYYDHNNWNFTRLGKIDNITQNELKNILGTGNVTVTLSIEE